MMPGRNTAQEPQCFLQTGTQGFKAFTEADFRVFPVGEGQDEVVEQMWEPEPAQRDLERVHRGEVRLACNARLMDLGKKHLGVRPVKPTPDPHPPLKGSQLSVLKLARVTPL